MKRRAKVIIVVLTALVAVGLFWLIPWLVTLFSAIARSFYTQVDIVKGSALAVAICALVVAWVNFRRGNTAIVRVVDVTASATVSRTPPICHKLEVLFKNVGIPLRKPSVSVNGFAGGWMNIPLHRYQGDVRIEDDGDPGTALEKGMVAKYALYSTEMDELRSKMLAALVEPDAHGLCVSVWSDGFLVKRFYLRKRPWLSWCKDRWNRLSFRLTEEFERVKMYQGRPIHFRPRILPEWKDYRWKFEYFVRSTATDAQPTTAGDGNGKSVTIGNQ